MKGIILAGGKGTRLYPLTKVTSKQLLPVYDKPMIYYPLSILMLAGIKDILIISTPEDTPRMKELLGDGSSLGVKFEYKIQDYPRGLAESFIIGEDFIKDDDACMILGDNIFYGNGLKKNLAAAVENAKNGKATIFGYMVNDPNRFGVVEFDETGKVISLEEKPENPKSNYAVTGLYFYPKGVTNYAKEIKPSKRCELEITDLNEIYLRNGNLDVITFGRGVTWMDAGTPTSLAEATAFVKMIEEHQGLKISCVEEIAYNNGWINKEKLEEIIKENDSSDYIKHLKNVLEGKVRY